MAEASEGNPLFALELARHRLTNQGGSEAGFDALLATRLAALPRATRLVLLCAALAAEPTLAVVAEAMECSFDGLTADLEPARVDGLIIATDRIRFNHPLYASAVIATADDHDLRATHTRLATCDLGPEARSGTAAWPAGAWTRTWPTTSTPPPAPPAGEAPGKPPPT